MLQHVIQRYLDSESLDKRRKGLCWFITINNDIIDIDDIVQCMATRAWCNSTAVPSTTNGAFPVLHPHMRESAAYWDAQRNESMIAGEYGKNRKKYAEFVRDYAEEYWK